MHLMSSSPMTVENQHWVMVPGGSNVDDPNIVFSAEAIYAPSPEAAVEMIRDLYRLGEFGEPVEPAGLSKIRLAVGEELPWLAPTCDTTIILSGSKVLATVSGMDLETILSVYGETVSTRRATPEEAERVIRANTVDDDQRDEEQFNYGFNVLYKQEVEGG